MDHEKRKGGTEGERASSFCLFPSKSFPFLSFLREKKKEKKISNYLSRPNGAILISLLKWDLGEKRENPNFYSLSLSVYLNGTGRSFKCGRKRSPLPPFSFGG